MEGETDETWRLNSMGGPAFFRKLLQANGTELLEQMTVQQTPDYLNEQARLVARYAEALELHFALWHRVKHGHSHTTDWHHCGFEECVAHREVLTPSTEALSQAASPE